MAQTYYFHCYSPDETMLDRRGNKSTDLNEARARAFSIIQGMMATPGPEDWRQWSLHISDAAGEPMLVIPFASLLGRPH